MKIFHVRVNLPSIVVVCHFILISCCNCYFVDLSHPFDNDTLYWSEEKPLGIQIKHNGTTPEGRWNQDESMCADTTHSGTHMDAPCHTVLGSWCVTDIPLERLIVPGIAINISNDVQDNADFQMQVDHLLEWEKIYGPIPDGCLLLVGTGWSKRWPNRLDYFGTDSYEASEIKFPSMSIEAAKWIVSNRDVVGVGIDSQSFEAYGSAVSIHELFANANIYIIEHVNDIVSLPATGFRVMVMPTKLASAGAAPVRVIAEIPDSSESITEDVVEK